MKEGLPSFNYREIERVEKLGYEIHIFPTKVSNGLYQPKPGWRVHRPSIGKALVASLYWLVATPGTFAQSFGLALRCRALPELALAAQFARDITREGVPAIHCHFADRKMFTAYFCSLLSSVPFSVTIHSHELTFYANRRLFRLALARCHKIISVCDYNRSLIIKMAGVSPEKVETIRLALPFEEFKRDERLKVLTVAKFHEYKGLDILVNTIRAMRDRPIVFWLVGDGPVDVRSMADDLIRSGNLRMLGHVNEETLKILYSACDVFCLPSRTAPSGQTEGLPVSIMEAMAFGKPVVTTRHAGIPELVDTIIVTENDPEQLEAALEEYLGRADLRESDGRRNRNKVVLLHGPENVGRLAEIFEEMAGKPR